MVGRASASLVAARLRRRRSICSADGFWRDYELPPGTSEGWTTAWVGWAVLNLRVRLSDGALHRAGVALSRASRPDGWGYNRETSADADSTAWAVRFLSARGFRFGRQGLWVLQAYLDPGGAAHTFRGAENGTWAASHPDVTPIVGLALLSVGAPPTQIERVRRAVLATRAENGVWSSFWWQTHSYATAWSLAFLRSTGGIPPTVAKAAREWLSGSAWTDSPFALAHRLLAGVELGLAAKDETVAVVDALLESTASEGGWPPSAELLVPPRHLGDFPGPPGPHADVRGLITTSIAAAGLARWMTALRSA